MREYQVIQNYALGAMAIRSFTREYTKHSEGNTGPSLPLLMPVLPMVFNERTCHVLSKVKHITHNRFLSALVDYRDLPAGLQQRMVDMAEQTFRSLNLAFALNLVGFDPDRSQLLPIRYLKKVPKIQYGDNQLILHGAKVLGNWFAHYSIEEICISLNIYF